MRVNSGVLAFVAAAATVAGTIAAVHYIQKRDLKVSDTREGRKEGRRRVVAVLAAVATGTWLEASVCGLSHALLTSVLVSVCVLDSCRRCTRACCETGKGGKRSEEQSPPSSNSNSNSHSNSSAWKIDASM